MTHHDTPTHTCRHCGATMRAWNETAADRPGTVRAAGNDRCASCYTRTRRRAQGTHAPRPAAATTHTGRPVELVRYTRTRDGIHYDLITGVLLHPTPTHWVVSVNNEPVQLPRNEWLEALAA